MNIYIWYTDNPNYSLADAEIAAIACAPTEEQARLMVNERRKMVAIDPLSENLGMTVINMQNLKERIIELV